MIFRNSYRSCPQLILKNQRVKKKKYHQRRKKFKPKKDFVSFQIIKKLNVVNLDLIINKLNNCEKIISESRLRNIKISNIQNL